MPSSARTARARPSIIDSSCPLFGVFIYFVLCTFTIMLRVQGGPRVSWRELMHAQQCQSSACQAIH